MKQELELELEEELGWEQEEVEDQLLQVANKGDVVPKQSPSNQKAQQPAAAAAAAAQDSAMLTAMVFSEAALPEQQRVQWPESREHSAAAEAALMLASMTMLTQAWELALQQVPPHQPHCLLSIQAA